MKKPERNVAVMVLFSKDEAKKVDALVTKYSSSRAAVVRMATLELAGRVAE